MRHLFMDGQGHDNGDDNDRDNDGIPTGNDIIKANRKGVLITNHDMRPSSIDGEGGVGLIGMPEVLRLLRDADERIQRVASGLTPPRPIPPSGGAFWPRGQPDESDKMGENEVGVEVTIAQVARRMAERIVAELGLGLGGSGGDDVVINVIDNNDKNYHYNDINNDCDHVAPESSHLLSSPTTPPHPHQPTLSTINPTTVAMSPHLSSGQRPQDSPVSQSPTTSKLPLIPKPILQRISVGIITSQIKQVNPTAQ